MMVSSRCNNTSRRSLPKKEKIVPNNQLGVEALPTKTRTMQGVLDWLKTERLHKYWPVFSRMTYPTLVGLTEGNFDHALTCIGSDPITNGARGRILRCTERLRERSSLLNAINELTPLDDIADIFFLIASTPMSACENEPNGVSLVELFRQKFNQVVGYHGPEIIKNFKLKKALQTYIARSEVPQSDKEHIEKLINNLMLAARSGTSPRGFPQKLSPPSSPPSLGSSSSVSPHRKQNQVDQQSISPLSPSALRPMYKPDCSIPLPKPPTAIGVQKTSFPVKEEKPTYPGFRHPPPGLHFPYFNLFEPTIADASGSKTNKPIPTCRPLYDRPTASCPPYGRNSPAPTTSRPLYDRPTASRPLYDRPTTSCPLYDRPTTSRPLYDRPTTSRPLYDRPTTSCPLYDRPTASRPLYDRPTTSCPLYDRPTTSRPLYDRPTTSRPLYDRPTTSCPPYGRHSPAPKTSHPLYDIHTPAPTISRPLYDRPLLGPIEETQNCRSQFKILPPQFQTSTDWPDPKLENAFKNLSFNDFDLSASIGASIDSLDLNKLWGGTKNQVMLDLNVTSKSLIRS